MPTLQKIKSSTDDATARTYDPSGNKRQVDGDITVGSCHIGQTNETNDGVVQRPTKRVKVEEEDANKARSESFNGAVGGSVHVLASAAGGGNNLEGGINAHDSSSLLHQGVKKNDTKVNNATSSTKSKGKKKKPKDPNAPKKSMTSYLLFCDEERPKLREQGMEPTGVALGERWGGLTDEQKQPYIELAAAHKDRYNREMAVYAAKNAGAASASGGVHDTNNTTSKDTKAKTKKKDPNHPKGATGSYIFFQNAVRAKFKEEHPEATDREVCTLISQKWKSMSEEEKQPYVEMNEEEKERYDKEMVVYNANIKAMAMVMKREGKDIDSPPTQLEVTLPMFKDEVMVHDSKNEESDEDDDSEDCPICHGKVNIWTDNVEVCNDSKKCGATFHKECITKYELEELERESNKGCIACCVLKPEEDTDNAESLKGMAFIVEGVNKNLASTINAFGGLVSKVTDVKKMEKRANERPTTFFVVNKEGNPGPKIDQARKLDIPFIGPAKVRLLALEKTTISQCKAQPPAAVYYAGSSPESAANSVATKTSNKTSVVENTKKASQEVVHANKSTRNTHSPMHAMAVAAQMVRADTAATKSEGAKLSDTAATKTEDTKEMGIDDANTVVPLAGAKVDTEGSTKGSQIESNKENQANDEHTNPSMFSGLGKSILAAAKSKGRAALMKSGFAGLKKKKHAPIVPEKSVEASNEIISGLEAMKKSVAKAAKGRIKSTDKDDDVCSATSSSSCDSLLGADLPSKSTGSPGKCSGHDDEVVEGVDAKQDSVCDGTSLDVDFDAACDTGGFDELGTDNAGVSLNGDNVVGVEAANAGAEQVDVSVKASSNDKAASCHDEPTQTVSNNSKRGEGRGTKSVSFAEAADVSATKVISMKLELVPLSRDASEKILRENKLDYSTLPYLIDDPGNEYNVSRKTMTLEMKWTAEATGMESVLDNHIPTKVTLGRNKVTGIKWSALSRELCDVSLGTKPFSTSTIAALLQMKKAPGEHALCINGSEHNIIVGQKFRLKHGDILSLYGRTGFAYRIEITISK